MISETKKPISTKFGNAVINAMGYYVITNHEKGHYLELLHRLIFEDFYNMKIPKGYVIHHKDGNKLNNCILNLQLLRRDEHMRMHNSGENNCLYGKKMPLEYKIATSKYRNSSGYFRVTKDKCPACKQGFVWKYQFYDKPNNKRINIVSVNLENLKQKVIAQGHEWIKLEEEEIYAN